MDGHRGYADQAEPQWYSGGRGYQDGDWDRAGEGGWGDDDTLAPQRQYGGAEPGGFAGRHASESWHPQPPTLPMESATNPLAAVSPGVVSPGAVRPGAVSPGPVGPDAAVMSGPPAGGPPFSPAPAVGPAPTPGPAAGPTLAGPAPAGHTLGGPTLAGPTAAMPAPVVPEPARESVYRTRRPALALLYLIGVAVFEWPALRLFAHGGLGDNLSSSAAVSGMFLIIGLPLVARGLFALQAGAGRLPHQRAGHVWLQPPVAYLTVGVALLLAAGLAAS